jgi:hypothetical protein
MADLDTRDEYITTGAERHLLDRLMSSPGYRVWDVTSQTERAHCQTD